MLHEQLSKHAGIYAFSLDGLDIETAGERLPLLSVSTINSIRRMLADDLDSIPAGKIPLAHGRRDEDAAAKIPLLERRGGDEPLMRSRYCVRHELGLCPRFQGAKAPDRLFLLNNGRRFALNFDCTACEMTVTEVRK